MADLVEHILRRFSKVKSQRSLYETTWDEISEFVGLTKGYARSETTPGQRTDRRVYDTTAVQAKDFLAATLHGGLTNPSTKWVRLKSASPELQTNDLIKRVMAQNTDLLFDVFNSPVMNFYSQNHEIFQDLVLFGSACMYIEENDKGLPIFHTLPIQEIYASVNKNRLIDTVWRKFKFSARQAAQFFGIDKLPDKVTKALAKDPEDTFEFLHVVMPNEEYITGSKRALSRPFIGHYISLDDKALIDTGGFYEMPYIIPRWTTRPGEVYGISPAWQAMTDIRFLNKLEKDLLIGTELAVAPTMLVADDGVMMPLRTVPRGVIFGGTDPITGNDLVKPLHIPRGFDVGMAIAEEKKKAIRNAFFIDPLLNTPVKSNITVEERLQRSDEKLRLLGPHVGRMKNEYLDPLVKRTYGILQRGNHLVELPDEIADLVEQEGLGIEYSTPLAQTERSSEPLALQRLLNVFLPFLQTNPELLDNLNLDIAFKESSEIGGVPNRWMIPDQVRDQMRQARQQQQAQMQALQSVNEGVKTASIAKKSGLLDEEA